MAAMASMINNDNFSDDAFREKANVNNIMVDSYGIVAALLAKEECTKIECSSSSISTSSCSSDSSSSDYYDDDDDLNRSIEYDEGEESKYDEDEEEEFVVFLDNEDTSLEHEDLFTVEQLRVFMLDQINNKNNNNKRLMMEGQGDDEHVMNKQENTKIRMKEKNNNNISFLFPILRSIAQGSIRIISLVLLCYAIFQFCNMLITVPIGQLIEVLANQEFIMFETGDLQRVVNEGVIMFGKENLTNVINGLVILFDKDNLIKVLNQGLITMFGNNGLVLS